VVVIGYLSEEVKVTTYIAPAIVDIGSLHELTLSTITKAKGDGDMIVIAGETITVPGGSVTKVS